LANAAGQDQERYLTAVATLCGARLLLPIVASGDEHASLGPDPDRHAEMAAVLLTGASGETAVLAFTGLDSLQHFDRAARPVPCTLDDVAASAVQLGASAVLIDHAGPSSLVIEQPLLAELAQGRRLVRTDSGWGWLFAAPDAGAGQMGPS
ncbi:MAG: SseB family protein, partial [Micropruina sp.]